MAELSAKNTILTSAVKIANEMTERIAANEEKKSGLCIRSVLVYICLCINKYKDIPRLFYNLF